MVDSIVHFWGVNNRKVTEGMSDPTNAEVAEVYGTVVDQHRSDDEKSSLECGVIEPYDVVESRRSTYDKSNFECGVVRPYNGAKTVDNIATDEENGCCNYPAVPRDDIYDFLEGTKSMRLLKFFGAASIVLALIQLSLGAAVFSMLVNVKLGAWWAGILALFSGCFAQRCRSKILVIITLLLSFSSLVISAVGAIVDCIGSSLFNNLASSTSYDEENKATRRYGDSVFFESSDSCVRAAWADNTFIDNGCYVSTITGNKCYEFTLSSTAKTLGMHCGMLMTRYSQTLMASVAFCILLFISASIISAICCALLCCPDRLTKIARPDDEYPPENIIVGIHGHENTF